jgi:hypothetical protein
MLATPLVQEIDRLLKEGKLSQRKIAARLGVSRGTVGAIAGGRRGLHGKDPQADAFAARCASLPPVRCPHCGYRVYQPCLVCRARRHRERRKNFLLRASVRVRSIHSLPHRANDWTT